MTKTVWSVLLVAILALNACNSNKTYQNKPVDKCLNYSLIKKEKFSITGLSEYHPSDSWEFDTIEGIPTAIFHINTVPTLYFLNMNTNKIYHQIGFPYDYIRAFHFYNKDSILVFVSNTNFENSFVDSTLFLADFAGNIYKYFILEDNILHCRKSGLPEDEQYYPTLNFNDFCFIDTYKIFLPLFGGESFPPRLAYYDLKKEEIIISKNKWNPLPENRNLFYPASYYKITYSPQAPHRNEVYFMVGYLPKVFMWNIIEDTVIAYDFTTEIVDAILPAPAPDLDINITNAVFHKINYDKYRKLFYIQQDFSRAYKAFVIIALDEDLNKLSESLKPKFSLRDNKYFEEYIIRPLYFRDTVYWDYFLPRITNRTCNIDSMKAVLASLYNPDLDVLSQYLKECPTSEEGELVNFKPLIDSLIDKQPDSFCVITIHSDAGCPSCFFHILSTIRANKDFFRDRKDWFLIVIYKNKDKLKTQLKDYALYDLQQTILIPDTQTEKYFVTGHNPRLTIIKDGKVTFDKIYQHEPPNKLIEKVMEFYGY